jgi:hypothetical protein
MKGLLTGLLLGSGWLAGAAAAQDVQWHAATPTPPAPPSLASCVAVGQPLPLPSSTMAPATPHVVRASPVALDPTAPVVSQPGAGCCGPSGCASSSPDGAFALPDASGPERPAFWARAEYLLRWFRDQQVPPLVTTGPAMANGQNGFLGAPGTVVLLGGNIDGGVRSGARLTVGGWCDDDCDLGVEASGFFIGQRSFRFSANSSQFPVLARPFFSLNTMSESAQEATTPGRSSGSVSVDSPSRLWGAEIDLRCNLCCGCGTRLDFLAGPRYVQLDEGLHINESLLGLAGAGPQAGSQIFVNDRFDTRNQFYGGQVGLDYELTRGRWSLDLLGKLALGVTHQEVDIAGSQLIVSPTGMVTAFNGGLLALPSNSGHFTRDRFSVLPEVTLTLGYQLTDWCRLSVGYNLLYWSSVVRPGDQIDRVLDETLIPNFPTNAAPTGQLRPAPTLRSTDFWAQGVNFGVEFRF